MALKLRVGGWILFLIGGAIFLWMGGFENPKDPVPWIGLFTALLGMILTSSSNLVAHLDRMKKLKRPSEPPPSEPPQGESTPMPKSTSGEPRSAPVNVQVNVPVVNRPPDPKSSTSATPPATPSDKPSSTPPSS